MFDAILIHHVEYKSGDMPEKRSPHQRYVFWNMEAAQWMPVRASQNGIFNWTMTYKMNSDFPLPYGRVVKTGSHPEPGPELDGYIEQFGRQNRHLAGNRKLNPAWLVSHCDTKSNREEYVEKLQRYLNVSIYGYCGDLNLEVGLYAELKINLVDLIKFYL